MLTLERVTKRFLPPASWLRPLIRSAAREPVDAVREVSFDVARGEVVGLIGPNGAGKTTLIKMISALLEPTEGRVLVDGLEATNNAEVVCRRLGLVLEGDQGLYDRLTGTQNLEFYGMLAGLRPRTARQRAADLMEMFDLADRDKLTFGYSAGMRMRLSIARALLADPPLIVLDEPTRSLDPLASRFVGRLVRTLADDGHAILFSSHRLDEVVEVCSRVVALVDGKVRFSGPPETLTGARDGAAAALGDLLEREANQA